MPTLMDIFTAGDEVVRFEPVGPEDVRRGAGDGLRQSCLHAAKPGFLVLYSFIKDARCPRWAWSRCGGRRGKHERETYLDQPADAFALIVADPAVEVIAHSRGPSTAPADR